MNLIQLTFLVAVNMMGSGIIMLPANMAQVGAISLLSWLVTAVGSMAIAYGFAQAGLFNQRPGIFLSFSSTFFRLLLATWPSAYRPLAIWPASSRG
jgi:amino acid transporter